MAGVDEHVTRIELGDERVLYRLGKAREPLRVGIAESTIVTTCAAAWAPTREARKRSPSPIALPQPGSRALGKSAHTAS